MCITPSTPNGRTGYSDQPELHASAGVPPAPPEDSPKAGVERKRIAAHQGGGRADVRQAITDRMVAMLARGGCVFRERWMRAAASGLPHNAMTARAYCGVNVLLLWDAAVEHGYASNLWLTYAQALALGARVRRGEKAVLCAYFERKELRAESAADFDRSADGERSALGDMLCKPVWVFNVAQVDGMRPEHRDGTRVTPGARRPLDCSPIEGAMRLIGGCRPDIRHGFARAAYAPRADRILMPDVDRFTSHEAYCASVLHEMVHWTGHPQRLARVFSSRFGDAAYAFEELVVELGSTFVLGHIGLRQGYPQAHAAYLEDWLHLLRNDRMAIFSAARHASDAFEFILARRMP